MAGDTMVKPQRRPGRGRRAIRIALFVLLILVVALLSMFAGAYVSVARTLPSLDLADRVAASDPTKIFDSSPNPVLLAEVRGPDARQTVPGTEIPQWIRDAVVAVDDPRFYDHKGMDFRAILQAAWAKLRHRTVAPGGSVITQQLIKNAFVTDERSAADVTREPLLAYSLERKWTKEKILNEYLNHAYFGSGVYGVQAAARSYFGIDADELTLAESALLAGLPASPSAYSPRRDPQAALARRDLVLNRMYQQRYISSSQLQAALEEPLRLADLDADSNLVEAPWVDFVREQLIARYGSSTVMSGGLRVYTSLDMEVQGAAEQVIADVLTSAQANVSQGQPLAADLPSAGLAVALVALDVHSGQLVAMVGDSSVSGVQENLVTEMHRPAGTAFEPFILVTALDQGISPEATYLEEGDGQIGSEEGDGASNDEEGLTLREAVGISSRQAFVRLLADIGTLPVIETALQVGLVTSTDDASLTTALTGPSAGVTPLEMAVAYATLATGGERPSARVDFDPSKHGYPVSIVRVTDARGQLLDENSVADTRVIDRGIAELVTSCLRDAITTGTGPVADIGRPAAGKAGTTPDGTSAWFVGYTPDLVTAVWVGSTNGSFPVPATPQAETAGYAAEIWTRFTNAALAGTPASDFSISYAAKWVTIDVCSESHLLPTELCPSIVKRLFRADDLPTDTCGIHVPRAVSMPDLVGLSLTRAKELLTEAQLGLKTITDTGSLQPAGVVTRQDHEAGKPVLQGTQIVLHVSAGQMARVPTVTELTLDEAQARLAATGLVAEVAQEASDTVAAQVVISQDPSPGSAVRKGSTVRIVVSSGPASPPSTEAEPPD